MEGDKPRRVLDLGCGIAAGWCLSMLGEEGWEGTQFVGESHVREGARWS